MFKDPYGILKILSYPDPESLSSISLAQKGIKKTNKPMLSQEKMSKAIAHENEGSPGMEI